ncbi:TetR/AcrR family transcriptional regulator [Rhodococcus sp. 05-2254-6]|nr:TetR/AcrR family transcriptional regulator [Rhodococcus sp. 05-2254-6]OZE89111.1 TetR/AcrR family transcriptional regulator [Rhodococcus sp. 15-2388-1-1a]
MLAEPFEKRRSRRRGRAVAKSPVSGIAKRRKSALTENSADYSAKRAGLLRVAAEVFREKGYAAASLNDVAAAYGTDRASLYYYVGSKEELFQECITSTVVTNLSRADEIVAKKLRPRETLEALIAMLLASQVEHYPYMYVYMQEDWGRVSSLDSKWAQEMVDNTHKIEKYFLDAIALGVADGTFRPDLSNTLIANSIFGMTQWTHRWFVPGKSRYSAEDLSRVFSAIFFDGIMAEGAAED